MSLGLTSEEKVPCTRQGKGTFQADRETYTETGGAGTHREHPGSPVRAERGPEGQMPGKEFAKKTGKVGRVSAGTLSYSNWTIVNETKH